jgi:hypothetical protein
MAAGCTLTMVEPATLSSERGTCNAQRATRNVQRPTFNAQRRSLDWASRGGLGEEREGHELVTGDSGGEKLAPGMAQRGLGRPQPKRI